MCGRSDRIPRNTDFLGGTFLLFTVQKATQQVCQAAIPLQRSTLFELVDEWNVVQHCYSPLSQSELLGDAT